MAKLTNEEKLFKDFKQLKENYDELRKVNEGLTKKYDALVRGEYVCGHNSSDREPLYKIDVTLWGKVSGRGFLSTTTGDLKSAKLIELALQKIFPSCEVKTSTKKDVWKDDCDWRILWQKKTGLVSIKYQLYTVKNIKTTLTKDDNELGTIHRGII